MALSRGYKVREYVNGRSKQDPEVKYKNYSLTVPAEIAESLPADMEFVPKMTDEGILYQPITLVESAPRELPEWARQKKSTTNSTSRKRRKSEPQHEEIIEQQEEDEESESEQEAA
jgi:hypothetical protein